MDTLDNSYFHFTCDTETGCFKLRSLLFPSLSVDKARLRVQYQRGMGRVETWVGSFQRVPVEDITEKHGAMHAVGLCGKDQYGLSVTITFGLLEQYSLFLWRIALENQSAQSMRVRRVTILECGERYPDSKFHAGMGDMAFFAQGWQSWNHTAAYGAKQVQRRSRLNFLEGPMYINPGTPQTRRAGHYSADFFGVIGSRRERCGWLAGFLAQREQYGSLEAWLEGDSSSLSLWANGDDVLLEPGARMQTDWAVLMPVCVDDPDPLGSYIDAVARENQIPPVRAIPTGWCSWYYLYQKVTAEDVRRNIASVVQLGNRFPLEMIQIDDGYQAQIGDWLTSKAGFSDGMDTLAAEIKAAGMMAGLWLAPFLAHPKSTLYRKHPEWLLRGKNGRPVYSLFNWNARMTALDPTHPDAQEFIARVIDTAVHRWGYAYLKLDFLYAGGLPGRHFNPRLTRAQALRNGLEMIRAAAGSETIILGCGMPLGTGLGLVDALRVGADTEGSWEPRPYGIKRLLASEPGLPALRNAMQNPITRADLHRRWWFNDPDCLLVRPTTDLTDDEVRAQATLIAMTGGALLLSDDLPALPPERRRIVEVLLPLIGQRPRVLDWFDRETPRRLRLDLAGAVGTWSLLAWFNMDDRTADFTLRVEDFGLAAGAYWLREFWNGQTARIDDDTGVLYSQIPAHGVVLVAARRREESAQYLGSSLHVSQGMEVAGWKAGVEEVCLDLSLPRSAAGSVELYLPFAPSRGLFNGSEIALEALGGRRYRARLDFESNGKLRIVVKH